MDFLIFIIFLEDDILPRIRVILRYKEDSLRNLFDAPTSTTIRESDRSTTMLSDNLVLQPTANHFSASSDDESIEDMPLLKEELQTIPISKAFRSADSIATVAALSNTMATTNATTIINPMTVIDPTTVLNDPTVQAQRELFSWKSFFLQSCLVLVLAIIFYFLYPIVEERKDEFFEYILLL